MFRMLVNLVFGIPSQIKMLLLKAGGLLALLAAFKVYIFSKKKEAVKEYKLEEATKIEVLKKDAKRVGYKEKRAVDGLSDSDLSDRLRSRSDDWGRL